MKRVIIVFCSVVVILAISLLIWLNTGTLRDVRGSLRQQLVDIELTNDIDRSGDSSYPVPGVVLTPSQGVSYTLERNAYCASNDKKDWLGSIRVNCVTYIDLRLYDISSGGFILRYRIGGPTHLTHPDGGLYPAGYALISTAEDENPMTLVDIEDALLEKYELVDDVAILKDLASSYPYELRFNVHRGIFLPTFLP